jgi:MoxR-like ATPase
MTRRAAEVKFGTKRFARAKGSRLKVETPVSQVARLEQSLRRVIRSQSDAVRLALIAILAEGHVLIEDVPGVGKTTLAHAIARALDCSFQRIQFTSDLLPSDVIGINIYNQALERFEFKHGPVFANIVLADEINRTTPKTQSALLEAMNERQVTVDNDTYPLPRPFMVLATQNPVEHHGTYPLPESQLDRFLVRIRLGYPDLKDERAIIRGQAGAELLEKLEPVLSAEEVIELQQVVREVHVDDSLVDYELALVQATRHNDALSLGVSPRGAMMLHRAAQASALLDGRNYCVPNDFKRLVVPAFAHRVIVNPRFAPAQRSSEQADAIISEIRSNIPVPE